MSPETVKGSGAAKGRLVGFVSLGALLALVGVAFYSSRQPAPPAPFPSSSPSSSLGARPTAPDSPPASRRPEPTAPPEAPPKQLPRGLAEVPRVTDSLPKRAGKGKVITAEFQDVALSPQARLLAERLKCVCGCGDLLSICVCKKTPGSRDMKQYLQELVNAGKTPGEIESAMVARYGDKVLP